MGIMKRMQLILIALTALSGCTKKSAIPDTNSILIVNKITQGPPKKDASDTLTYLALGDSYTIGEGSASYPDQLTDSLNAHSFHVLYPTEVAQEGWTTDNLISGIAASGLNNTKFDFVTLLIGVNDEAQGISESAYKLKFVQALSEAVNFANGDANRVFVLSIPDWGVTPYAKGQDATIGPKIDDFNAINQDESENAGANYLNITAISREAATDPTLLSGDGLHPSAKMYTLWIQQLEPLIAAQLKK